MSFHVSGMDYFKNIPEGTETPGNDINSEVKKTVRKDILEEAEKCVCGQREEDYGSPEDNFRLIAEFWSSYTGAAISSKDVAVMMALLKIARIKTGDKRDNFVDLAGYAACAGEVSLY